MRARMREAGASFSFEVRLGIRASYRSPRRAQQLAGQNCTIVATDVVGFGGQARTDADRIAIRAGTVAMTEGAFMGIWADCGWQDCGDGAIVVIPPDTPTSEVLRSLLGVLPPAVSQHNAAHGPGAQIQLRVSVNVGPVATDATGLTGDAIIHAARMLDALPFKEAVARGAPAMGLIISPFVFDNAVRSGGLSGDAVWTQIATTVKERDLTAWYYLIGPEARNGSRRALPRVPFPRRQAPSGLLSGADQARPDESE